MHVFGDIHKFCWNIGSCCPIGFKGHSHIAWNIVVGNKYPLSGKFVLSSRGYSFHDIPAKVLLVVSVFGVCPFSDYTELECKLISGSCSMCRTEKVFVFDQSWKYVKFPCHLHFVFCYHIAVGNWTLDNPTISGPLSSMISYEKCCLLREDNILMYTILNDVAALYLHYYTLGSW